MTINFRTQEGPHFDSKLLWADNPKEAKRLLKKKWR